MKILFLSAGTGSFYCGTCMRDNAVVNHLRSHGHDIHLMPLYLPFSLDESDATDCPLFFGGINSYLQQKSGIFRQTPRFLDAMLDWKPLLRMTAQLADMTKATEHGDLTISMLRGLQGNQAKEMQRMIDWVRDHLSLDVICISNLMLVGVGLELKRAFGLPLVASLQGEDSYLDALPAAERDEAWGLLQAAVGEIDYLIGVSPFFAEHMRHRLQARPEQMRVVQNGLELEGYVVPSARPQPPELGFFAHITPSKGLHSVVDAFISVTAELAFADWRLRIGGSCTKADEKYLDEQKKKLDRAGLAGRVSYHTNLTKEEKQRFYQQITVLSVAPTYAEAFGMYVIEALACGTPLITPARGNLTDLLRHTDGGEAVPVGENAAGDGAALAAAYRKHLAEPAALQSLQQRGVAARAIIERDFSATAMAEGVRNVLHEAVVGGDG